MVIAVITRVALTIVETEAMTGLEVVTEGEVVQDLTEAEIETGNVIGHEVMIDIMAEVILQTDVGVDDQIRKFEDIDILLCNSHSFDAKLLKQSNNLCTP